MRASRSTCSRLWAGSLVEAVALAIARPPAFPQEFPAGTEIVGIPLARLNQKHRTSGFPVTFDASRHDFHAIVEYRALRFVEAAALDALGALGNAFFQRQRDEAIALAVVDPGENQGHRESPKQRDACGPEGDAAERRGVLAPQYQPQPGDGARQCEGECGPGKLRDMPGLEPGEMARDGGGKSGDHREPAEPRDRSENRRAHHPEPGERVRGAAAQAGHARAGQERERDEQRQGVDFARTRERQQYHENGGDRRDEHARARLEAAAARVPQGPGREGPRRPRRPDEDLAPEPQRGTARDGKLCLIRLPPQRENAVEILLGEREPAASEQKKYERALRKRRQILAPAPGGGEEGRGKGDDYGRDDRGYALGERGDGETQPENPSAAVGFVPRDRDAIPGESLSGEHADLAKRFMRVHQQAEAAEQDQRGARSLELAVELAARQVHEGEDGRHHETARQAGPVVGSEHPAEQLRGQCRDPVVKRPVFPVRLARQVGDEPAAVLEHLMDDADTDRVLGFPQIVADEARQQVGEGEQREKRRRQRKRDPRAHFRSRSMPSGRRMKKGSRSCLFLERRPDTSTRRLLWPASPPSFWCTSGGISRRGRRYRRSSACPCRTGGTTSTPRRAVPCRESTAS